MADTKLTGLTELSDPELADYAYLVDVSNVTDDAAGSSRKVVLNRLLAVLNPAICQGRLTLESGVPVSTSDQTAKTSVYFTPYNGAKIGVYDGTRWKVYDFTERTLALGTITSDKNYDVFIYDNAGTLTLELSAAWTNDTTRADALTTQNGVYVKSGATTRRLLGTIRTTSTTTTEDSDAKRFLANLYCKTNRRTYKKTSSSHTYATNTTRSWNNDTANRTEFVVCEATKILLGLQGGIQSGADSRYATAGIGVDSTSADTVGAFSSVAQEITATASRPVVVGAGYHFIQGTETANSAASVTFVFIEVNTLHQC